MSDECKTKTIDNVVVQENGILRNCKGGIIARLVDSVDFDSEQLLNTSAYKYVSAATAVTSLSKALQDDPDFAWSWHCNIAMMCYDAIRDDKTLSPPGLVHDVAHKVSNEAAARFMKLAFDVETKEPLPSPPGDE